MEHSFYGIMVRLNQPVILLLPQDNHYPVLAGECFIQQRKYQPLGKILGSIAKDYNGILAMIEGHAHMLGRQLGHDALNHNSLKSIVIAAERGCDLTRRLIQLSEFPSDTAERGDLVAAIRHNRILLKPVLGSGAEIQLNVPNKEIYIPLCEEGITQILIGCVLDARLRHAGMMTISVSITGRNAVMHVTDNGIEQRVGMLHHAGNDLSEDWQMVNEWVVTGNGTMNAVTHEHQGGDVMIMFPLGIQSANPFADKTILVVDDGHGLPDIVANHLHPFGVQVLKAANAEQALILHKQNAGAVDVLLADTTMPELNGVNLAEMLVAEDPDLRVVYLVDQQQDGFRTNGLVNDSADGVDGALADILKSAIFVPKPLSLRRLSASLERALQTVQDMGDQDAS